LNINAPNIEAKPERRRTQQERSRDTREKLLRATIEVLAERGYAGLTTAQVEAKAGVSSGARVHHFRTKEDLVVAATQLIYDEATRLGQTRAESAKTSKEPIRAFIEDCRSIYFDWPFLASVDVMIASRTVPSLMPKVFSVLEKFHATMKATWMDALVASGQDPVSAELDLRLTLNMMRGMALNKIWQNDQAEYDRLIEVWCQRLRRN
jgi:AcrR family transcriptional regulator